MSCFKAISDRSRKQRFIVGIMLAVEIVMLVYATWRWGVQHLDSDDSAEMILAELLSRSGEIISKNWYYSTEIRVLNTQLVMSPLFHLFSDWHVVRTFGTAVLLIVLACSYLFLCKSSQLGKTMMFFAPIIVWPFSPVYQDIVLYGLYYIPHLCIIFLTLGLLLNRNEKWKQLHFWLLLILSFVAGLGGIRMLVVCYVPLFLATILTELPFLKSKKEHTKSFIAQTAAVTLVCACGYLVNNRVLAKQYSFVSWGIRFVAPQKNRLIDVIRGTFSVLGAGLLKEFSLAGIARTMALMMCCILIYMVVRLLVNWRFLEQETQILLAFFACSYLTTSAVAVLTLQPWSSRYLIMPCMGFVVVLAAYFKCYPVSHPLSKTLCAFLVVAELITGIDQYRTFVQTNKHQKKDDAYEYILNSGIDFGFGDWDASDMLTEVSNGRIHLCKLIDFGTPQAWYWLMEKDFQKYAKGKPVFLILDNNRLTFHGNIGHVVGDWEIDDLRYLDEGTVVFQDEYYTVWEYDSYEQFEAATGIVF